MSLRQERIETAAIDLQGHILAESAVQEQVSGPDAAFVNTVGADSLTSSPRITGSPSHPASSRSSAGRLGRWKHRRQSAARP